MADLAIFMQNLIPVKDGRSEIRYVFFDAWNKKRGGVSDEF